MTITVTHRIPADAIAPQLETALEWWFVQGRFRSEDGVERDFMASLFRYGGGSTRDADGSMLLTTLGAPGLTHHLTHCAVSPALIQQFLKASERAVVGTADLGIIDAFREEVEANGPPAPIVVDDRPVRFDTASFALRWGEFTLRTDGEALTLDLPLPADSGALSVRLAPIAEWLKAPTLGGENGIGEFAYVSCPRLELTGSHQGRPVTGEAWFDHQFGGHGWLRREQGARRLIGWDWLGASLDDGRQLLVVVHRDPVEETMLAGRAVLFCPGLAPELCKTVQVTRHRGWLSPRTMVDYPVDIEFAIPALAARLRFEPRLDDQEVPVFGLVPAIWEGAGTVSGEIGGTPVSGHGRLELFGYGLGLTFKDYQTRWTERIDRTLREYFPPRAKLGDIERYLGAARWRYDAAALDEMIFRPMWTLLGRGGKRWRPLFGLMLLEALGVEIAPYEELMTVVPELIHNASLVIDDIEDGSAVRRGGDTVHRRVGIPTAINAANTLYYLPMLVVGGHPHLSVGQRERIYRLINDLMVRAHFGQAQDIYWSKLSGSERDGLTADPELKAKVLQAYAFKSAAVVRGVAEIACIIAESDETLTEALMDFAESWGVAFQIVDDVNSYSDQPDWGKVTGEDLRDGKVTVVLLTAFERLPAADCRRLHRFLARPADDRDEADFQALVAAIRTSDVLGCCRAEARAMAEAAWEAVRDRLPPSRAKVMIRVLIDRLTHAFEA